MNRHSVSLKCLSGSPSLEPARGHALNRLALLGAFLGLVFLAPWGTASGQYIFADTDGNGSSTAADTLSSAGAVHVDIWLDTDRGRDGTQVRVPLGTPPLTINAYELLLAAVDGTVQWGEYTNRQPSMSLMLGRLESPTEIYVAYGGTVPLPPGEYKLGTLEVGVKSGAPRIEFRSQGAIHRAAGTAFGSLNPGKDGDYVLKFTQDRSKLGNKAEGQPGDWADADGVGRAPTAISLAAGRESQRQLVFGVKVSRNAASSDEIQIVVTTTRSGFARVRLFDLQGRLVRTLLDEDRASPGEHVLSLGIARGGRARLASGIYFYRVETSEAVRTGRIAVLR